MPSPLLIDTHAHVNFSAFKSDRKETLARAREAGIWMVNVGSQYATSAEAVDLAADWRDGVWAIVGLHPIHLFSQHVDGEEYAFESREESFSYEAYRELARSDKVVGIGECGLEYYHLPAEREQEIKKLQQESFVQQIELAVELKKTLMVHSRDAYQDIYDILKPRMRSLKAVVIHSFIGNREEAKKFVDIGCFIGFNGIITYKPRKEKKSGASDPELLDAVRETPLDRIVLETDSPYLSPEPLRGKRNEPARVRFVAEKLAELKKMPFEDIAAKTTRTARTIFNI